MRGGKEGIVRESGLGNGGLGKIVTLSRETPLFVICNEGEAI